MRQDLQRRARKLRKLLRDPRRFATDALANLSQRDLIRRPRSRMLGDRLRVMTMSFDDSTFFVSENFRQILALSNNDISDCSALIRNSRNADYVGKQASSDRVDIIATPKELYDPQVLESFDLLFFAKAPPDFDKFCRTSKFLDRPNRPLIACAFPGLEFSPERGFKNRLLGDAILFNTQSDRDLFRILYPETAESKALLVGNPSILARWAARDEFASPELDDDALVFLSQNITPQSLGARARLLETLVSNAPRLIIKSRQKKNENQGHVHKELFSYETIARLERIPAEVVHCSMEESLRRYGAFLTCSSTGGMEAAAVGKRVGFVASFEGHERDAIHVKSLGYSTRYGLTVELSQPAPTRAPPSFFEDFGLSADNEALDFGTVMRAANSKAKSGTHSLWREVSNRTVAAEEVATAYVRVGNPEKAAFSALARLISAPTARARNVAADMVAQLTDRTSEAHARRLLRALEP